MLEKLIPIVAEQLHVEEAEIKPETDFKADLSADSLDLFELVMALEEATGIPIEDSALAEMRTVGDVMNYLNAHKQ